MSRTHNLATIKILKGVSQQRDIQIKKLYLNFRETAYKEFYNLIYRLVLQGLIEKNEDAGEITLSITEEGSKLINRFYPEKDGVWKLIIFDIPEKHKYVRNVLRAKLKALNFKKWQNSIWISPYALDIEIERELKELSKKFFVRLIKTTEINHTEDLEKLFK